MIRLHETIEVARTRVDCYRYLVDFSTCEQWDPGVYRAVKRTPGAPGVNTAFDVTVSLFGHRSELRYRIEALEPDTRIELSARGDGLRSDETIGFTDAGNGRTAIDYRADFELTGALRASTVVLRPLFVRMGRKAVRGLREALTIDTQPPTQGWLSFAADRSVIAAAPAFTERGYRAMRDKAHSEFMDGRTVVITGATSGIGRAAACEYARLGAHVALVGRDAGRLAEAKSQVHDFCGCDPDRLAVFEADLLELDAVRAAAEALRRAYPRIDVLVNNAGAMFAEHARTADGFERTLALNLIAPYALTELLLGPLTAAEGRVVNMSSGGMYLQPLVLDDLNFDRETFEASKVYARAKRGLVALTHHWARRYGQTGVRFNAMHPGWVATPGVSRSLPRFERVMRRHLRDPRMGADTAVWLGASTAAGACNGQFFLDRRPHPTAVLPNTRVRPSEAQSLYGWLRNHSGVDAHGFG